MHLEDYTAQDLALHHEFRLWVLNPTRELNAFWSEWLRIYPEKLILVEQARLLVENTPFKMDRLSAKEIDFMIGKIESALTNDESASEIEAIPLNSYAVTNKITSKERSSRKIWLYCAATVALLIASTFLINFGAGTFLNKTGPYVNKVSPLGQISVFNLSDGSRIWLGAGSSLRYPDNFTASSREIYLTGEAYFEVARDTARPFTVYTGNISTTALGTSFNIDYFEENEFTDVSLITGKAIVKHSSESGKTNTDLILTPGEMARLNADDQSLSKSTFEPGTAACWKDGVIYFKDATFQNVKDKLERTYNIEIKTINSSDYAWSYNGYFDNENLNLALKKIALTEGFEFTIKNDVVEITFNR